MVRLLTLLPVLCSSAYWAYCDAFLQPKPMSTIYRRAPGPNSEISSSTALDVSPLITLPYTALLIVAPLSLRLVKQGDVKIVERLGKFHKRLPPGLHVTIPLVDTVRAKLTEREQVFDIPPQACITSDNAPLTADAVVYWRIVDPEKSIYAVEDIDLAIQNLVLTQLRAEIGKLTLDMTFSARDQINSILLDELDETTKPWGVKITRVEVRDIIPNREILKAMELQIAAERTKRADVIKSEGEREKAVNEAEGRARSVVIDAEAVAKSVLLKADAEAKKAKVEAEGVAEALDALAGSVGGADNAGRFQLVREFVAAQRDLATSENAKVVVTSGNPDDVFAKAVAFFDGTGKISSQDDLS